MKILYKILSVAAAALLFAAPAFAAYQEGEGGPYVALNVGQAVVFNDCNPPGVATSCTTDRHVHAYFAAFGYQYSPFWALEASYGKIGYITSAGYGVMPLGLSVSGVFNLNVIDEFGLYVKVGATYVNFHQDNPPAAPLVTPPFIQNATGLSGGVGLRYAINPKLDFLIQGDYFGSYAVYDGATKVRLFTGTIGFRAKY